MKKSTKLLIVEVVTLITICFITFLHGVYYGKFNGPTSVFAVLWVQAVLLMFPCWGYLLARQYFLETPPKLKSWVQLSYLEREKARKLLSSGTTFSIVHLKHDNVRLCEMPLNEAICKCIKEGPLTEEAASVAATALYLEIVS